MQQPTVASRPTNSLAIASLAAGIAGYVIPHPFIASIIAIVTGHMARGQIRRTGEAGKGLATAGLVLGYIHLALSIAVTLLFLLIVTGLGVAVGIHHIAR